MHSFRSYPSSLLNIYCILTFRKVKEAWETKREALERTGNLVIEQLRDALSAKASSQDVPNDLAVVSVDQCVEKV